MTSSQFDDIVRTSIILIDSDLSVESCVKLGDKDGNSTQSLSINVPIESSGIGLGNELKYDFHKIFTSNQLMDGYYNEECKPIIYDIINNGKNGCISHYRNHFNSDSTIIRSNGLIHWCLEDMMKNNSDILFFCSYIEINGDQLKDLGKQSLQHIQISNDIKESLPVYRDKFPSVFHNNPYFIPFHEQNDEIIDDSCKVATNKDNTFYIQNLILYPIENASDAINIIENGEKWSTSETNSLDGGKESKESKESYNNSNNSNRLFQIYMFHPEWDAVRTLSFADLFDGVTHQNSSSYIAESKEDSKFESKEGNITNFNMNNSYSTKFDLESIRRYMIKKGPVNSCLLAALHQTLKSGCNFSVSTSISCSSSSYYNSFCALSFIDSFMHYGANGQHFGESKDQASSGSNEQIEKMKNNMKVANPAVNKFISSLQLFGITASLTNDEQISINGKSVDVATIVGTDDSSKDRAAPATSASTAGSSASKKGEPSVKKLQKMISDLEDEVRDAKTKAKDRKDEITEKTKQVQSLTLQLTRSQTSLRHKEFQYDTLQDDKTRLLEEQDHTLTNHHNQHIQTIITDNQSILAQQHKVLQSVPENLRVFTATRNNFNKQFKDSNAAAKIERDSQMRKISDASRAELRTLKLQYEHWLAAKNDQIKVFADQFNQFRIDKSNQLQACEMEVVRLYDHVHKLENILTGIEQGEYNVTQKQGLNGRSTTGVLIPVDEYYDVSSRRASNKTFKFDGNGSFRTEIGSSKANATNMANTWGAKVDDFTINIGGVMLPKGLRPTNPFITPKDKVTLATKIVRKYKSLEAAASAVQESEFQKTLEKAATGTALGVVDPKIQERISQMISTSSMSRDNQLQAKIDTSKKRSQKDSQSNIDSLDSVDNTDNNNIESKMNNNADEMKFNNSSPARNDISTSYNKEFSSLIIDDKESPEEMKLEITRLRNNLAALENELENQRLKTDKIVRGISSDETINYILKLETEHRDLHKKMKAIASQLQAAKVSNAALQRSLKK